MYTYVLDSKRVIKSLYSLSSADIERIRKDPEIYSDAYIVENNNYDSRSDIDISPDLESV